MKQVGSDCLLKIGTDTIGIIRDATFTVSGATVDVTARDSSKWREKLMNIKEWSISGQMLYKKADVGMDAIRTAALAGTKLINVMFIFKELEGFKGDVFVAEGAWGAPLEDGVTLDVTLEGTGAPLYMATVS